MEAVRRLERCLGDSTLGPAPSEAQGRREFRLSCVAARDLPGGHCLSPADIGFRRPGHGLAPKMLASLQGRELAQPVPKGHVFTWGDLR